MGKKSVGDDAIETALDPQQVEPDDLYQEVLKTALQARLDSEDSGVRNLVRRKYIFLKIVSACAASPFC